MTSWFGECHRASLVNLIYIVIKLARRVHCMMYAFMCLSSQLSEYLKYETCLGKML